MTKIGSGLAVAAMLWTAGSLKAQAPETKPPDSLRELSASLQALSRRVSRAVVQVFSTGYVLGGDDEESTNTSLLSKQHSSGSGVTVTADGYIVTNAHVVQGARRVRVQLPASREQQTQLRSVVKPGGETLDARVIGMEDRKSTRLNSSHIQKSRMPSSA